MNGSAGNSGQLTGQSSIVLAGTDGSGNPSTVAIASGGSYTSWFDYNGSSWVERYGRTDTLTTSSTNHTFTQTDTSGVQTTFNDFSTTWSSAMQGKVTTRTDPAGNPTTYSYNAAGNLTQTITSSFDGTNTTKESFLYSYLPTTDPNAGMLQSISLGRKTYAGTTDPGTPFVNVQQSAYTYYGNVTGSGSLGDLQTVSTWDGSPASVASAVSSGGSIPVQNNYYEVTAITPSGETGASVESDATTTTGNQTVALTWNAYPGATGYKIYRGTSSGGEKLLTTLGNVLTYTDSGGSTGTATPPAIGTTYNRWYTAGDADTNGYPGALKYVLTPESFARAAAALPSGTTPLTATASQLAPFADDYYQYDGYRRVSKIVAQGTGSSSATPVGLGTTTYAYANSENIIGYNNWSSKTTSTLPDGTVKTDYFNGYGEQMLEVVQEPLSGHLFGTFTEYDNQGRAILTAQPSAVSIPSLATIEGYADLLNNTGSYGTSPSYQYLSTSSGLINITDYYTTTTATSSTAGGVVGYVQDTKVEQGEAGTPILQESEDYISQTGGGATIYPIADDTTYGLTGGGDARKTSYSYSWFSSGVQMQSETVTKPVISSGQNGPGTADASTTFYDTYGRPIWMKDGDGFITYTAYDPNTGAVVKSIGDVNTADVGDFTNLPTGWTTPANGGLELITAYTVDSLGRTTKTVDPNGNVTYTVYNDVGHEQRVYPGFNSGTGTTTGPIQISRTYYPAANAATGQQTLYTETLTSSATPHLTGSVPDGTETLSSSNIQSLSRSLTNAAGQTVESDAYFSLSGQTYTQASAQLGLLSSNNSASGNYHATLYSYDTAGRQNRVQAPTGTINRTVYDGLGRVVSQWTGTTDTYSGTAWSPATNTGNIIDVQDNVYDGGSVGDGNLTQSTVHVDTTAAHDRVMQNIYDFRDRPVASKQSVLLSGGVANPSGETDGAHRPIVYTQLDNAGEAMGTYQYDGDGIPLSDFATTATTDAVPTADAGNLRAEASASYDDQGRSYLSKAYSVNQSTGAVATSNPLNTNTFYDHRGNVAATYAPGGLATKTVYDGAGRVTKTSQTDGGQLDGITAPTWANATSLSTDVVLSQTVNTLDADGNVLLSADKERFDNDSTSSYGDLGTENTGIFARVYYVADYYDAANRLTDEANYGNNAALAISSTTRPTTVVAPINSTTTSGGTTTTLVDTARLEPSGFFLGYLLTVTSGTQSGKTATITGYSVSTHTLTFSPTLSAAIASGVTYTLASPALITHTDYNGAGWAYQSTDPRGIVTRTSFDMLGRTTQTIAAYTGAAPTSSSDQTTNYTYDGDGNTLTQTAVVPAVSSITAASESGTTVTITTAAAHQYTAGQTVTIAGVTVTGYNGTYTIVATPTSTTFTYTHASGLASSSGGTSTVTKSQTTAYVYGVGSVSGTDLFSNDLLKTLEYPDPTSGAASPSSVNDIGYKYNWQAQQTSKTDQIGNVHAYTYDVLGRLTLDAVTTLAGSTDGTVRALRYTFDTAGRPYQDTSYSNAAGTGVVNQDQFAYDGWGQETTEYQAVSGAVNTGSTPKLQYTYTENSGVTNNNRLVSMTYPGDSRILDYGYNTGLDSAISRVSYLKDDGGTSAGVHLEEYTYLGLGTIVAMNRPEANEKLTYIAVTGDTSALVDAQDRYTGLDRFGRVIDQYWEIGTGTTANDRFQYGYDKDGNVLYKNNVVYTLNSELYRVSSLANGDNNTAYDPLGRLVGLRRGTLGADSHNGGMLDYLATFNSLADHQEDFTLDAVGNHASVKTDGTAVAQTANAQNETTAYGASALTYDNNGNQTKDAAGYTLTYDAWNRLVKSSNGPFVRTLDAQGRMVTETGGSLCYYDSQGGLIDVSISGEYLQYVRGLAYQNEIILRDRNADGSSTTGNYGINGSGLEERVYSQQDANWNTTSLFETSIATPKVVERLMYSPYGTPYTLDPTTWASTTDATWYWRPLFQGEYWMKEANVYVMGAREYDPTIGTWVEKDPAGYVDGMNDYQAFRDNPTNRQDPTGNEALPDGGTADSVKVNLSATYKERSTDFYFWENKPLPKLNWGPFNEYKLGDFGAALQIVWHKDADGNRKITSDNLDLFGQSNDPFYFWDANIERTGALGSIVKKGCDEYVEAIANFHIYIAHNISGYVTAPVGGGVTGSFNFSEKGPLVREDIETVLRIGTDGAKSTKSWITGENWSGMNKDDIPTGPIRWFSGTYSVGQGWYEERTATQRRIEVSGLN